jgi:hypothetical protein
LSLWQPRYLSWGRFLISPLGTNFDPQGWSWPPVMNFVP